jgi:hypothetical protein
VKLKLPFFVFLLLLLVPVVTPASASPLASPYSISLYQAQQFSATNQTGSAIQLNGLTSPSTVGSSYTLGTVTVTGTSLTTVTFGVLGSSDNGFSYYPLPITSPLATPSGGAPATTVTATANGVYQVPLGGLTHVKFVTSGTFTATAVSLQLSASPNAQYLDSVAGGGAINPAAAFAPAYYPGDGMAVSGATPFDGPQCDSTTGAPAACAPDQVSTLHVHTIAGVAPTLVVYSATNAGIDENNYLLGANANSITLPNSASIADGQILLLNVSQPLSGSAFTVAAGSAGSVLTPGVGTTLVNARPGGCPTIGTTVSATNPSQLLMTVSYRASITQYTVVSCQVSNSAESGASEFPLSVTGTFGSIAITRPIASIVVQHSGTFKSLSISNFTGGTCTTPPILNVFDGSTNIGTPVAASSTIQARGAVATLGQTLSFNAGDTIGIYVSTAGATCTVPQFNVSAEIVQP